MTGPSLLVEREGYGSSRRGQASHTESTELPSSIERQETHPSPQATDVNMDDVSSPSHQPPSTLSPPSHHPSTPAALQSSPSHQPPSTLSPPSHHPSTPPAALLSSPSHQPPSTLSPPSHHPSTPPAALHSHSPPPPMETLPQEDSPPPSHDMSTTHPSQSHVDHPSPLQGAETPPQQSISPDTTTLSSPRPLHERIFKHISLTTDTAVTQHPPSPPADTKEAHPPTASDLEVEQNYSYTDRDSFDWNVSWSSTAGTSDPTQSGTAKRTTSEGSEYDGIVAVAICDTGAREGGDQSPDQIVTVSATPAPQGQRPVLESDTDITPMPDYRSMATPHLKVTRLGPQVMMSYCVSSSLQGECARFGVRALPKRKMIAKLEEIYDYTHPLVGEGMSLFSTLALTLLMTLQMKMVT